MNLMFLPLEHKIHIFEPTCNVLFIIWRNQFNKSKRREPWRHWTIRHSQRWHTENTPLGFYWFPVKHAPPYNKMESYFFEPPSEKKIGSRNWGPNYSVWLRKGNDFLLILFELAEGSKNGAFEKSGFLSVFINSRQIWNLLDRILNFSISHFAFEKAKSTLLSQVKIYKKPKLKTKLTN